MPIPRPALASELKRELRRRAGFGCCRCGSPIYQYHHVVPYGVDPHFRADDMMLLCPTCHDAATKGALAPHEQRRWQSDPFNRQRGHAAGALMVNQPYCAVRTGGVLLVGEGPLLVGGSTPLLSLSLGPDRDMELSALFEDETGSVIAAIDHNEWVTGDLSAWDIESDHQLLTIRNAPRNIAVRVNARGVPTDVSGQMWWNGLRISFNASGLSINRTAVRVGLQDLGLVGITIALQDDGTTRLVPYLGNGMLVSDPDPLQRLVKSVAAWWSISEP